VEVVVVILVLVELVVELVVVALCTMRVRIYQGQKRSLLVMVVQVIQIMNNLVRLVVTHLLQD
jgi:hypothetical protein